MLRFASRKTSAGLKPSEGLNQSFIQKAGVFRGENAVHLRVGTLAVRGLRAGTRVSRGCGRMTAICLLPPVTSASVAARSEAVLPTRGADD